MIFITNMIAYRCIPFLLCPYLAYRGTRQSISMIAVDNSLKTNIYITNIPPLLLAMNHPVYLRLVLFISILSIV